MGVKVIRIYQLDGVVNARLELVGGFFEVEVPAGPVAGGYINKRVTPAQLAEALGSSTNPNHSNSLSKAYRYLTRAEIAANGGYGEAFEDFDPDTACINTRILIAFYQPDAAKPVVQDQILVAVFDPNGYGTPEKWVYVDGSFRPGDKTPAKWVPAEAPEAKYGYVRRDTSPATIKDWRKGELSIWAINGADQFATAKQAGGPFPAFTGAEDAYWLPAAAPAQPAVPKYYDAPGDQTDGAPTNRLLKAVAAGKADLVNGQVPASQLPSYVDDVLEFAQLSAFPATGETGKIYVAINTGKQYRYSGSAYVLLSDSGLTTDQLASFPAGASANNKLVAVSSVGLLASLTTTVKTSIVSAINELVTKITFAGLGMVKTGNLIGLQQSVANLPLPGFENVGLISDTDGTLVTDNDFAKGYRYSPFIALDPAGGPLIFTGGRPSFSAFYDKNFVFKRRINERTADADSYEAGIYYMRVSFPVAQYSQQSYSLGSLGYVRALRKADGTLLTPDQAGLVDVSSLASAGGGGSAGAAYSVLTYTVPAGGGGVQTLTNTQVPGLSTAKAVLQVGLVAADGTLDPELAEGTGFTFDATTQTLKLLAGTQVAGDYFQPGVVVKIKILTSAIAVSPPAGGGSFTPVTSDYYGPGSPPWPLTTLDDILQWNTSRRAYIPAAVLAQNLLPALTSTAWEVANEQTNSTVSFLPDGAISITPISDAGNAFGLRFQCNNNTFRDKIKNNTNYILYVVARITSPGATLDVRTEARGEGYHPLATGLGTVPLQQYYTLQQFMITTANYNPVANDNMLPSFFLGQSFPNTTIIKHVLLLPA